jgi:hypothetical protein
MLFSIFQPVPPCPLSSSQKESPMSDVPHRASGEVALVVLRFAVLASASILIGVVGHVIWKVVVA